MATNITYNDATIATLNGAKSAILECGNTKMKFDIVISTMDKAEVSYGGSIIAKLDKGQTATLHCAGLFMKHVVHVAATPTETAVLGQAVLGFAVLGSGGGSIAKLPAPRIRIETYSDGEKLNAPVIYIEDITSNIPKLATPIIAIEDSGGIIQLAAPIISIETIDSPSGGDSGGDSGKLRTPMIQIEYTDYLHLDAPEIYIYTE